MAFFLPQASLSLTKHSSPMPARKKDILCNSDDDGKKLHWTCGKISGNEPCFCFFNNKD